MEKHGVVAGENEAPKERAKQAEEAKKKESCCGDDSFSKMAEEAAKAKDHEKK